MTLYSWLLFVALTMAVVAPSAEPSPDDYRAQDGFKIFQAAFPFALQGNGRAVHDCFIAAYVRASTPFLGGDDLKTISMGLAQLLISRGDERFGDALAVERPEIVAAVRYHLTPRPGFYDPRSKTTWIEVNLSSFPRTRTVLEEAPTIDLPLNEASPTRERLQKELQR